MAYHVTVTGCRGEGFRSLGFARDDMVEAWDEMNEVKVLPRETFYPAIPSAAHRLGKSFELPNHRSAPNTQAASN